MAEIRHHSRLVFFEMFEMFENCTNVIDFFLNNDHLTVCIGGFVEEADFHQVARRGHGQGHDVTDRLVET